MVSLLPLFLLFLWTEGTETSKPSDLPFVDYLDQDHLVRLSWGFDNLQGSITFELVVNTTGWVGFGLSPNGGMKGSDIVIGGIGPAGRYFADYHATGKSMPVVDVVQSYTLVALEEADGQTTVAFQRLLQSCDDQDFHITAQPVKLIYAYGTTDDIGYHGTRRGTKEVNLLNYSPRTASDSPDYFSVTVENITVPALPTYYHCRVTTFPSLSAKHHMYLVEPDVQHHDLVHHMLLYRCPAFVTEAYDGRCYRGDLEDACHDVVAAWGTGGGPFGFPDNMGIPIGGEGWDVFYRLEIHYNNPNQEAGRTDSSGLRFYYRPARPGQHDVGILTTGVRPGFANYNIPPGAAQFHSYGVCNTSVFPQHVKPIPDLQVFAVLLHTHLAGREVRAAHYRDGQQIDFFLVDENYNFEMQQTVHLGNTKTIQQGDEIAVECTYNTTGRRKVTEMGLATTDEMCLAFLFYYPLINVAWCISSPNTTHPLINTSDPIFDGNLTSDQEEIAEYENLLKTLPQIQITSDENFNFTVYKNGFIREMMKTPSIICEKDAAENGSSVLRPSSSLTPSGVLLLLFWFTAM